MPMEKTLQDLVQKRDRLKQALIQIEEMRQGSLSESYRKCGKPTCHCAWEGDPGHGPFYVLTRKDASQKTVGRAIPIRFVEVTREQIKEYHRFKELSKELLEVNEQICDLKLKNSDEPSSESVKKNTRNRPRP
ncbi:MAG: DUF6788 family protein [Leptospirillum sp.]